MITDQGDCCVLGVKTIDYYSNSSNHTLSEAQQIYGYDRDLLMHGTNKDMYFWGKRNSQKVTPSANLELM